MSRRFARTSSTQAEKMSDPSQGPSHLAGWKYWTAAVWASFLLSGCIIITGEISPSQNSEKRPIGDRTSVQPPNSTVQSAAIAQMEAQVRDRVNAIRKKNGLNQLKFNEKLAKVARAYSKQMAENNFFSHTGLKGEGPAERVRSGGIFYTMVGENLFTCTNAPDPVPLSVESWMNSSGHRENILRPGFAETGVGIWRKGNTYYFTQLFMRAF